MITGPSRIEDATVQDNPQAPHPRPQRMRRRWRSLDGPWAFAAGPADTHAGADAGPPDAVDFDDDIQVPFPPESPASGLAARARYATVWYRRSFVVPAEWHADRVVLHFGAVDYEATVWVNDHLVARHEGGHTPFEADITDVLVDGEQALVVRAHDDPDELDKPRGKQDWRDEPHAIWYPRTTGIWQSVWLEAVPHVHIETLRYAPDAAAFAIDLDVRVAGPWAGHELRVELRLGDELLVEETRTLLADRHESRLHLPDPGIDDARARFVWSPETPNLLDVTLTILKDGETVDRVESYTALRSVEARDGAFLLNGRPYFLRMVLDQGYWEESHLAAPSDEALRRDVELAKAMGFNGVRKHQKIEHPRYLHWADRLGLLVWEELPSAYAFTPRTGPRLLREWTEAIERDVNHPCVVAWVPFNESWGVPELPLDARQRHLVASLYHLTHALDGSRPVIGNDGWEFVIGDLLNVHDYDQDPAALRRRYGTAADQVRTVRSFRPAGRRVIVGVDGSGSEDDPLRLPFLVTEFGGVRHGSGEDGWGYGDAADPEELLTRYAALVEALCVQDVAGFCYTQFADTYQEQNGLLHADRSDKVDPERLRAATLRRR